MLYKDTTFGRHSIGAPTKHASCYCSGYS